MEPRLMNKKPVYLLAGGRGGGNTDPIMRSVFKDIGKASPKIAYVGVANGDNREFFGMMTGMLSRVAECEVVHARIGGRVDIQKAKNVLISADAIYVGGGDVEAGMQVLDDKGMSGIFFELYEQGKLCFGVSAGSIILAREWIRWSDPNDDATAELFSCLGVANVLCDTHSEADHWEELQAALRLKEDSAIGYGITSGACLTVYPDGRVEALGGAVHVYTRKGKAVVRQTDITSRMS
jgi:peptidase E